MQWRKVMCVDDAGSAVTRVMSTVFAKEISQCAALETRWGSVALKAVVAKEFVQIELPIGKPILERSMLRCNQ